MAEYRKIKKVAILLKEENQKLSDSLGILDFGNEEKKYLTTYSLASKYSTAHNISRAKAEALVSSALKHDFLIVAHTKKGSLAGAKGIQYLDVNPKEGYDLMQTTLLIPTGVINASLKQNKTAISILTAIVIAIATVINVVVVIRKP